ncbi:MAG: hypothetical protein P8P30_01520 [Rickettsiales bacterium]|nr:hypothetical protein [Rickettsiales bacterium]
MWQKFKYKEELLTFVIILPFIFGSVFLYKRYIDPPLEVTHEHALPWDSLQDAFQALSGRDFLYGETLKKLQGMEQKTVAIYGYMYPIRMGEKHNHFLLSKRSHVCQFHIPSHSGNMVEVIMEGSGIAYTRRPILLTGVFSIPNDKELGITFRLEEAEFVDD